MLEQYEFYRELIELIGEAKAKELVVRHFQVLSASKIISDEILETCEPDIREYIGKELFGPIIKPFIKDLAKIDNRVTVVYTVIIPKEHVRKG